MALVGQATRIVGTDLICDALCRLRVARVFVRLKFPVGIVLLAPRVMQMDGETIMVSLTSTMRSRPPQLKCTAMASDNFKP